MAMTTSSLGTPLASQRLAAAAWSADDVNRFTAASCAGWAAVAVGVHVVCSRLMPQYRALKYKDKLSWCNRVTSGLHAIVLVSAQLPNLANLDLLANPLHAVSDAHFRWGSLFQGYLVFDTLYNLAFYKHVGSLPFLLHHALGFLCCGFGLYYHKMAVFGMATQVLLEATTPLLHLLGCLKSLGHDKHPLFVACGLLFITQFFVCRVVLGNLVLLWMTSAVAQSAPTQVWAWCGVVVLASLSALNLFWFSKLLRMGGKMIAEYTPASESPESAQPEHQAQMPNEPVKGKAGGGEAPQVFEIKVSAAGPQTLPTPMEASSSAVGVRVVDGILRADAPGMAASLTSGARYLLDSLTRRPPQTPTPRASLTDEGDYSEPLPVSQDAVRLRTTLSALEDSGGGLNGEPSGKEGQGVHRAGLKASQQDDGCQDIVEGSRSSSAVPASSTTSRIAAEVLHRCLMAFSGSLYRLPITTTPSSSSLGGDLGGDQNLAEEEEQQLSGATGGLHEPLPLQQQSGVDEEAFNNTGMQSQSMMRRALQSYVFHYLYGAKED